MRIRNLSPLLPAAVLLNSCVGEFAERLEGVIILELHCSDLADEGFPIESRFPMGMFCIDGECTGDHGTMNGETHWYSNHCRSTMPDGSDGTVLLALLPFNPVEYDWEEATAEPEDGIPIAIYCADREGELVCRPDLPAFDALDGAQFNNNLGYPAYTILDWFNSGKSVEVGEEGRYKSLVAEGDIPLVYLCEDAASTTNCQACFSWSLTDGKLHFSCNDDNVRREVLTIWL